MTGHTQGMDSIFGLCLSETSADPAVLVRRMMALSFCHMHGPEHHVMVGAALPTAYRSAGGALGLEKALREMYSRGKVAFLCVHNSCRSQMAEALCKKLAGDVFDSFSAGTEPGAHINPDAVRLMKRVYGIDMEQTQHNKPLSALPAVDIVITMGCMSSARPCPAPIGRTGGRTAPAARRTANFSPSWRGSRKRCLT